MFQFPEHFQLNGVLGTRRLAMVHPILFYRSFLVMLYVASREVDREVDTWSSDNRGVHVAGFWPFLAIF
jgi:hypothetical protein